jgi:hypothetical protein
MKVHASRRRRVLWFALAASLAVIAVGAFVTRELTPVSAVAQVTLLRGTVEHMAPDTERWQPLIAEAAISAGARLRTVGDGGAAFAVGKGVSVRAAGATSWVFDAATRLTLEDGTLYVDTGARAGHGNAIEIVTPHGVVDDLGTQFEVRTLSSELRVRVREGSVELSAGAAPAHAVAAGEELRFAGDRAIERRSIAADAVEWAWAQALAVPLELDGGSTFDALQWVARELGKRLVFEDANAELLARNAIIHGSSAGLEPLQILEVVMATSVGLDYTLGEGTLVIRRR